MPLSLRSKILALFIFGLSLILLLVVMVFSSEVYSRYKELMIQRGSNTAQQLAHRTERLLQLGLRPKEFVGYDKLCQELVDDAEEVVFAALIDGKGNQLFHGGEFPLPSAEQLFIDPFSNINEFTITIELQSYYGLKSSVLVIVDQHFLHQKVLDFVKSVLAYSVGIISIGIVIVLFHLRSNLGKPLDSLVTHIQEVDLNEPPDLNWEMLQRKDELGIVARTFNQMIGRLSQSQHSLAESNTELLSLTEDLERRVQMRTKELEQANRRLRSIAHSDALTGFSNRWSFEEVLESRFEHAKRYGHSFAILLIDLDGFKKVNDDYGHSAGDQVLVNIGQRVRSSLRGGDSVFRIGGDEFVFIVEDYTDWPVLRDVIEKAKSAVLEPTYYQGIKISVGVSIGVSTLKSDESRNAHELVALADEAMYEAKRQGKSYMVKNP